jgi:hypothetical protein
MTPSGIEVLLLVFTGLQTLFCFGIFIKVAFMAGQVTQRVTALEDWKEKADAMLFPVTTH